LLTKKQVMTRAPYTLAAVLLSIGLAVAAHRTAVASSAPLPPDEAYEAVSSARVANGIPWGGTLTSGGRELLVAERRMGHGVSVSFSIRDTVSGQEIRRLRPRAMDSWAPQWDVSADGARLVLGVADGRRHSLVVIDVASDQDVQRLTLPEGFTLGAVAISPDARWVAGVLNATRSSRVHVWDVQSAAAPREVRITSAQSIDVSPDGARVLTAFTEATGLFGGSSDGVAEVWDVGTSKRLTEVRAKDAAFLAALFSPDGTRILTANRGVEKSPAQVESSATLWDAGTGKPVLAIGRGEGPASSISFSGDGSRIATASQDRRVRVWDARTGDLVARLGPHGSSRDAGRPVMLEVAPGAFIGLPAELSGMAATFAGQGSSLVTSGLDGTVNVWVDVAEKRAADKVAFNASQGLAQGGDAAAMYRVMAAYRDGRGVAKNAAVSSSWLTRAADAGHAAASVELGNLLVSGSGERQDCIEGGARLRKASSQGDADAGAALDALLSPVGGRQGAAAMSAQIQADLLETQIIDVLKRSEYPAFLTHLCALEALGHAERLPPQARHELVYHRAVGLRAAGKPKAALAALTQYLNEAGNAGANYTAAIRLLRPLQEETR
jgi:WD40 repeat protein